MQKKFLNHLHSIEGIGTRYNMGTVPTHQEVDALVEGLQGAQAGRDLGFLNDIQRIGRAHTERCCVT